jgi:hypothetical protein
MSGMSGNPWGEKVADYRLNTAPEVLATLALAYEQRTAALVAFYATIPSNASDEAYRNLHKTVIARLGLSTPEPLP